MKKFILKISLFILPLIISCSLVEILIRNIPNDYSYKKQYLDANSSKIQKLFLGSSHAYYGINPTFIKGTAFNLSHISQTINYDYELIMKYNNKWNDLECITIPIDYFTFFSKSETNLEAWRIKNYQIYYKLKLSLKISEYFEILSIDFKNNIKRINSFYILKNPNITCSELGYGNIYRENKDLSESGIEAAKRHTEADLSCLEENTEILESIIDFALNNNIQVLFYTSPAYNTYISNLNKNQLDLTINTVANLETKYKNCTYYNFFEDQSFIASDFRDADHLNSLGAKKLSLKLDSIINTIVSE